MKDVTADWREFAARYATSAIAVRPTAGALSFTAQSFMTAFPDMRVTMDELRMEGRQGEYHWTLTGTNSGPGGTGRKVRISGFEVWRVGADGLIASSLGHFDQAEYRRQLATGAGEP